MSQLVRGPAGSGLRATLPAWRRPLAVLLAGALAVAITFGTTPRPATAGDATPASLDSLVVGWLNRDRAARGLAPVQAWSALGAVATTRAQRMAAANTMTPAAAGGDPGAELTADGIRWTAAGEILGESSYPWGSTSAGNIYTLWTQSPVHAAIMFSSAYNYVGAGFVLRSDGTTWVSVVFSHSADHSPPVATPRPAATPRPVVKPPVVKPPVGTPPTGPAPPVEAPRDRNRAWAIAL
jgi:uncharacterized protein YkwD